MNETDIKKCIKHGYAWSSCGDKTEKTSTKDYTRSQLKTFEGLHATKAEAQFAIGTRREDAPANDHAEVKCDMPETLMLNGKLHKRLAEGEPREIGDVPVDGSQTHRFGSIWYRPVESHETPVGETQGKEVVTDETQPTILEEAAKCVTGPRRRDYGTPDENFGHIAALWSVQLKHEVTPMQVAMCLILLKVARQSNSPKRDNLVDIAGYAQCASELKGAK